MHGLHSAVMDCGISDRRPPRQTAPIDVFSSSWRLRRRQKLLFGIRNQFIFDSYRDNIGVFTFLQFRGNSCSQSDTAVMDCGISGRRPSKQTAPIDMFSSSSLSTSREKALILKIGGGVGGVEPPLGNEEPPSATDGQKSWGGRFSTPPGPALSTKIKLQH
jgi:hypothetical protein